MNFLNIFLQKFESSVSKPIGKVECHSGNVTKAFFGMMSAMGMGNPSSPVSSARKGVKVKKKGNNYVIHLYSYNPPLEIVWTETISFDEVLNVINKLSDKDQTVGFFNTLTVDGIKNFQLALAK